jgi:hypothetical protein
VLSSLSQQRVFVTGDLFCLALKSEQNTHRHESRPIQNARETELIISEKRETEPKGVDMTVGTLSWLEPSNGEHHQ